MRPKDSDVVWAIELTRRVLAKPGTPMSKVCPLESMQIKIFSIASS